MTYSIKIIGILLLITLFSSCLKDGEDLCHSVGSVKIDLFVEKFRNQSDNPLDDREDSSLGRVNHLRYFIYKEGLLYEQGIIDKFTKTSGPLYSFLLSGLDYGNYNIVFVANCTKKSLRGDSTNIENLLLTFPGCEDTEDFFSAVFPFSVDSDNMMEYEVGLKRTHGIVRCTFNNLPNNISDIEIIMKNVNMEYWIAGDYKVAGEASRKYSLTELKDETVNGDYIIGTFPTPINEKSIYYLNIYKEDEATPYISQMITDDFEIRRNQLLDISVTFNDGYLSFEIDMDSDWDGPSSGGEVGIE
ncbi:FimB/Mfa2 family fimbrial subunit [Dysgonomonas sp. Marseille-P4677]|uniref:FimB/Mfa2 family fimbrial subunit n=1 Tax=Dysgonomonas sp. Marseille-P4677 TaxID=2364790 RepID=UPI001911F26B|nr:FimB/Mfa2 family fimbrial subunit [Dysgonomonas sp. Marseille-P4677]MBK5722259.1 FimB/Mfa2 family fimbrial subunit [Dysgonomonas sp. Marseille-P4677]